MPGQKGNILVVDDNKSILSALEILLTSEFDEVRTISNPNLIPAELSKTEYNLIILDMNFAAGVNTGNEGIFWLKEIKKMNPDTSVVMITAYGDVETAVRALKAGASDFILKPWDNEKLIATLRLALQLSFSKKEIRDLKETQSELKKEINREQRKIIGSSPRITGILDIVRKVAGTDANVLITGENGTGKELVAREIHRLSARSGELMVSVDVGALTETLFESELFGHVKGAFTDARENRPGKFEIADKGTLFLDEIGNISFHLQAKLLKAVESRQITRVGSNKTVPVDIRLICATNKNLDLMVNEGLFREDLLYRINTIHIELPPLRERGNDIITLAEYFLDKYSLKYNKPGIRLNRHALDKLMNYTWPGNIRELENTVEKSVILSESKVLKPEDIYLKPVRQPDETGSFRTLDEMEEIMINLAIDRNNGNLTAAAAQLGITRQTLYNKLKSKK
ncbi:MAG TPA: sigma-54 dependent transcriptional regulator [Bacteroidales bacterium]|nr:sigma-54 dependent transcriptional regulator [Bacteroidales bacterium]HPF02901.1 sigma-54 dependent transcriptional regulator [Bacteroidales bacterium]HPR13289.1 sigma-54 dependent transcriptional regulator [Bacteroidales bacterium]HRW85554.1 sigma-54 dependent transcriptional regulator [Bacteroidales bacterium]